jgi:mRNA-degrading endonuclease toxin of MazEF toxin-antitoxin module
MSRPRAGDVVIVDWRVGARPKEQAKTRPAVVVEDSDLFPDGYPNLLVAPMTSDEGLAHRAFAVAIDPDEGNGVGSRCWVLSHHVTSVSLERVRASGSHITAEQLTAIRDGIVLAVGG